MMFESEWSYVVENLKTIKPASFNVNQLCAVHNNMHVYVADTYIYCFDWSGLQTKPKYPSADQLPSRNTDWV